MSYYIWYQITVQLSFVSSV